jgi:hypothetical protein
MAMGVRRCAAVILSCAPALAGRASAVTIHVPGDFPTIQAAIDASADGDEIVLAEGLYTGPGNRDLDFGGRLIAVRSAGGDPSSCMIDCEGAGRGFRFHLGETASAVVQGLTVRGGSAPSGGAVLVESGASPVIRDCVFEANAADAGGALYLSGGAASILGCTLRCNSAATGGAVRTVSAAPLLADCVFEDNQATNGSGGAIRDEGSSTVLVRCRFAGNRATIGGAIRQVSTAGSMWSCLFAGNVATAGSGGAVRLDDSDALIAGCAFSGNAAGLGAAVYASFSSPAVGACTFAGNSGLAGSALHAVGSGSSPVVAGCVVWGNADDSGSSIGGSAAALVSFSDVQGGFAGPGNIDADPLYADSDGPDDLAGTLDDDLRLLSGSPAIDAGDAAVLPADWADLDGDGDPGEPLSLDLAGLPRVADGDGDGAGVPDMGAYELAAPCSGDLDRDGSAGIGDLLMLLGSWGRCAETPCAADLDGDGTVGIADLLALLGAWGPCP